MGKLNTALIDGFDTMSADQKLEALLGLDIPDAVDMSKFVDVTKYEKLKSANDKTSSELSTLKKQLSDRMTDEEKSKADADANMKDLQEKYDALLKKSTIDEYVNKFLAQGYDDKLARETAEALYSGDMEKVFENGTKFKENILKTAKADALRDTPRPGAGESGQGTKLTAQEEIAVNIGKRTAEYNKASSDIISKYL